MNCFVSNQVVPEGKQVVVFPIRQQKDYEACNLSRGDLKITETANCSSISYNNSLWNSLGLVFTAKAQESYRLTINDSPMNRVSLMIFFYKLLDETFITEEGSNSSHDFAFNAKLVIQKKSLPIFKYLSTHNKFLKINELELKKIAWNEFKKVWEEVEELIHESRVFIRDYKGRPCLLKLSLCLTSAYDYVVKNTTQGYNSRKIDDKITNFDKSLKNYQKYFKKTDPKSLRFLIMDVFRFESGDGSALDYSSYFYAKLSVKPTQKTSVKLKNELKPIIDFSQFQHGLNDLNLKFIPISGGSQDYMNETGALYSNLVAEVYNENQKFIDKKYKD